VKRVAIAVVVIGALFWARKRFVDAPKVEEPTKAEVIAEKIGRIARAKREGKPINPGDLKLDGTSTPLNTPPADTTTITQDQLQAALNSAMSSMTPEQKAKQRVQQLLTVWQQGSKPAASIIWATGVTTEISGDFNPRAFDDFAAEKSLQNGVQSFEVNAAYHRNDGTRSYTVVDVMINGAVYHLGVSDKTEPIFWTF